MKKICLIILIIIILIFCFNKEEYVTVSSDILKEDNVVERLIKQYGNEDIVAVLEIPSVLSVIVLQSSDNDYYLKHNVYKNFDKNGEVFLDYRVNINDYNKLIIYGHNNLNSVLPFRALTYYDYEFYKKHSLIYLYTLSGKRSFEIFSSYVERDDFDYVNLENFDGSYLKHIQKLKDKSLFKTDVSLDESSKILILQTCNYTGRKTDGFRLVLAKEV